MNTSQSTKKSWTAEEILALVEKMKERFLQDADYLFCNPADYEELEKLVGHRLNVKSNAGVNPGTIYLVDRSAIEPWRWISGFEGEAADQMEGRREK